MAKSKDPINSSSKCPPSKGRQVTENERELWENFMQNEGVIAPKAREKEITTTSHVPRPTSSVQKQKTRTQPQSSPQNNDVDGNTMRRLKQGKIPIEGTLDLHGMRQEEAHSALHHFVQSASASGKRCVLVITGKGRTENTHSGERGVLRKRFLQWVKMPPLNQQILQTITSAQKDGGSGAFYVYLRRRR